MSRFLFAVGKLGVFIIDWNQLPVLTLLFAGLVSKKPNSPRRRVANKFHNLHWPDLVSFQQFSFFSIRADLRIHKNLGSNFWIKKGNPNFRLNSQKNCMSIQETVCQCSVVMFSR
jgi:hypothetical protein